MIHSGMYLSGRGDGYKAGADQAIGRYLEIPREIHSSLKKTTCEDRHIAEGKLPRGLELMIILNALSEKICREVMRIRDAGKGAGIPGIKRMAPTMHFIVDNSQ